MTLFWLDESDNQSERRIHADRRTVLDPTIFPVYTASGNWVRCDRRCIPDRRLRSITVTDEELFEEEFSELFKEYS